MSEASLFRVPFIRGSTVLYTYFVCVVFLSEHQSDDSSGDRGPLIGTGVVIAILASACVAILFILVVVAM